MPNEAPIQVKTKLRIFSGLPSLVLYFCVFFILLVFFMLSSNFVPIRGVEVSMPKGGHLVYASRNYVVTIDKDNNIYFNDKKIDNSSELRNMLSAISSPSTRTSATKSTEPDKNSNANGQPKKEQECIIIRCDVNASFATVAEILSLAEELNINAIFMSGGQSRGKTAILTEPES